ncbi:hypothetical protein SANT12839_011020 [Streptomyces antimycoticus]|uniref:Uncharacterized protein n=1 Tax=Streptomyces antimycoticus TaxID=68175 RepID=A0A4D4JZF4_9ACTN|nr:hypothetical protein SANT12839_011020 [Streptomyces antimycoticus]
MPQNGGHLPTYELKDRPFPLDRGEAPQSVDELVRHGRAASGTTQQITK